MTTWGYSATNGKRNYQKHVNTKLLTRYICRFHANFSLVNSFLIVNSTIMMMNV